MLTKLENVALKTKFILLETFSCICESKSFCFENKTFFLSESRVESPREAWAKLHFMVDFAATRLLWKTSEGYVCEDCDCSSEVKVVFLSTVWKST